MAKKTVKDKINEFEEKILTENLESIMGERFGRYSKYIIQDRALPDVRDGLKPVQRRILYAMFMLGMYNNEPYKKSARIVGEVIGKYHPHGDSSVYDAMVRLSQDFKMRMPLIDMHGNNGSIDGDSAAAMRYTEARLSKIAMDLLKDIDKKTVQFVPNFDDCEFEPVVLPAKFPNLLVNGATGISAGYATDIPPHNLHEIINLTIARIEKNNLDIDDVLEIVKGPDFPTGGIIEGIDEIKKAFLTGRGKVFLKSKTEIVDGNIIVSEIPYEVNKATLVRKIDEIRINKKIDGIVEVRDESDKDGLRVVIETKKQSNPEVVLTYLFKNTDLAINYNYNVVAINNKAPKLMGILEIIDAYIIHQKEVIRNRSNFELDRAQKRLHIVQGFIKMVSILNEVVNTIRKSINKADAKTNLISLYGFSEQQAEAIVMLQLYRLTNTDILEMQKEEVDLTKKITLLEKILKNEKELEKVIVRELTEINERVPSLRKTEIKEQIQKIVINEEELFIHENVRLLITKDNYIKRLSLRAYQTAKQVSEPGLKEGDLILHDIEVNTKDTLLLFTSKGSYINVPIYKLPDLKWKDLGVYIGSIFDLSGGETIISFSLQTEQPLEDKHVLLATKNGLIKQISLLDLFKNKNKKGQAMLVKGDDILVSADIESDYDEDVIVSTKLGMIIKYSKIEAPVLGNSAMGVKSIGLKQGDVVVSATYSSDFYKDELLLLTNRGCIKRIPVNILARSKRTNRGTPYLKVVKTQPYNFLRHVQTNVNKLKEDIAIKVLTNIGVMIIPGSEFKPDKYEHGIPYVEAPEKAVDLFIDIINLEDYNKVLADLDKNKVKKVKAEELDQSDDLLSELGDIINENDKQMSIFDIDDDISGLSDDELMKKLF